MRKTKISNEAAINEASSMNRPDLDCVWGNPLLPYMLRGDNDLSCSQCFLIFYRPMLTIIGTTYSYVTECEGTLQGKSGQSTGTRSTPVSFLRRKCSPIYRA